ncbi:MAG: ABC transporter substrate-binding protein [Chloroflexota bacterium]|nr:ABC transporter substrate-binding protein [Chloroflexota bacterium]
MKRIALIFVGFGLLLAACGGGQAAPSSAPPSSAAPAKPAPASNAAPKASSAAPSAASVKPSASSAAPASAAAPAASTGKSVCGLGNSQKATGTPIKLGAIATNQPGTDFTDIPNAAKAYFECVNENGGINGHPIDYSIETEQTDPGQVASLAKKLVESTKVVGIVGNTSIIECAVNHAYYEQKGFYIIDSGIAPECYSTSNSAPVNMGPRYSSDGAVQYAIRAGAKKIIFDQANVPGTGYIKAGPEAIAKQAKIPEVSLAEDVPIKDANSVALKEVQAAGQGGAVVLNFTPPEALKILQAAQQQGLAAKVIWACSTPCNTDFLAKALGPQWNGKLGVNAELNLISASAPDSTLYREVMQKYAPKVALGSFSQMGFLEARIAVAALLTIKGDYTAQSVNQAFKNVKDFKTDIVCKPWYYGPVPNNWDRTVTPQNGKMVEKEGCFAISDVDADIAKVRAAEAKQ